MKKSVLEIFNSHVTVKAASYEHPGCHMINNQLMREIVDDVIGHLRKGELRSDDLHVRIDYNKPGSSQGNTKLKGVIYMASHPLIDCYLDGLAREKPSCTGLNSWCYVFSDFFYKSFSKQLSMIGNSILYIMEPERAEKEISEWLDANMKRFVPDRHGHVAFRTDEAGDFTYCLDMWINLAKKYRDKGIMFYGYTKQFQLINTIPYNINTTFDNFRILASDSTVDDPNPITQLRENYGSFGINFKNPDLTPDRVKNLVNSAESKKALCPGAKAGCFGCTKCSENYNFNIWCHEH